MHIKLPGYQLFSASIRKFLGDDGFNLSLSISFVFLLSIIPFTTLSIIIFDFIKNIFLVHTSWTKNTAEMLTQEIVHIIPFISKQWVKTHVVNPDAYRSFKTINYLMLPIISGLIFKTLETSYRRIFQLPPRHLLLGQALYIIMSIFTILLFFIFNFIWIILATAIPHFLDMVNKTPFLEEFYHAAGRYVFSIPVRFVSALILVAFYLATVKLFLNVRIKFRYRLSSALLFCGLWLFARKFFGLYIQHISRVNLLYGSLSSVVVILIWIFYSSLALLFSVEVMYMLHTGNHR